MTRKTETSQPMLRLFAGGIMTETNVFSPLPTGLRDFVVARSDDSPEAHSQLPVGSVFVRWANAAAVAEYSYVQGLYAFATPAGPTTRAAYETLRDALLEDLRSALPVDAVLLTLHGQMVAGGYVDCETDLVMLARQLVGTQTKIGVLLDPHSDLPDELVEAADVIVLYKEYPHIDVDERADELARLVIAAAAGHVHPIMATFDCRMIGLFPTSLEPMRTFVKRLRSAEQQAGILSVSLVHGFPWGDSPATGTRILVVSDGEPGSAEILAAELGHELFSLRHEVCLQASAMSVALDHALSVARSSRPVVLADISDNAGGGAASDSTFVLQELLQRKVENAALALLWDPIAVQQAFAVGEGARLTLRLGGKMGPSSGEPLDLTVCVRGLVQDLVMRWPQTEGFAEISCGDCACLTCSGVDVVVSSVRQQVVGLEVFTAFGIDPSERDLLVVKSMNHFRAAFAPIAAEIVYMSTPGALNLDPRAIPYEHVDTRKFPWLDDPWAPEKVSIS
jgi:microcystin degradation protein MlrC